MRKWISFPLLLVAFCILGLFVNPFVNSRSAAISQERATAADLAAATETQKQAAAELTRSASAEEKFRALNAKAQSAGTVPVIIKLRVSFQPEGEMLRAADLQAQRSLIKRAQDELLTGFHGHDPASIKRFDYVPHMAVTVDAAGLEALRSSSEVLDIQEDMAVAPTILESVPLIGAPAAWEKGFTGAGKTIAILDTGIDKTHPFFTNKVVSEACYSTNDPGANFSSLCPGGVTESVAADSGLQCTTGADCFHGTFMAGIAAGNNIFSGVAKDANLISIQVFSLVNDAGACDGAAPCLRSRTSDLMKALERVYALRNAYSIASVNMSLAGGRFTSNCDTHALKPIIDQLRSVGIATVISSGNDGFFDAISAPACISSAISVGATGDGSNLSPDTIAPFSNSAPFLSLLAPGDSIISTVPGESFGLGSGTSMAAPHVAGAWAILKQRDPSASVSEILNALTVSGVKLADPRNGVVLPRIDIGAATCCIADVPANRWRGEYFNNTTLSGLPSSVRDDGTDFLNVRFGKGSPAPGCGLGADHFSARWTRTARFAAGRYRFFATGDKGVRLYIDGQLWIDRWNVRRQAVGAVEVELSAGDHELKLEYLEDEGRAAAARLFWTRTFDPHCPPGRNRN